MTVAYVWAFYSCALKEIRPMSVKVAWASVYRVYICICVCNTLTYQYSLLLAYIYCKRINFRAVHIFVHFAHGLKCAKI